MGKDFPFALALGMNLCCRVAARYEGLSRNARIAERVVARIASHESDMARSLNSLIKSNGGLFKSPAQAKFLHNALAKHQSDTAAHWGRPFMTSPDALAVGFSFLMEGFGQRDQGRRRFYGWLYVVDGAGVVAAAKADCDHVTGQIKGAKETIFERKGEAPTLYTKPAERPKSPVDTKMIEDIKAMPAFEESDLLRSFVQQLEKGRTLSPAQLAILQRKFNLGVSLGIDTAKYTELYKKLASEVQTLYKSLISVLDEVGKKDEPEFQRMFDQAVSLLEEDLAAAKKPKMLQKFRDHDTITWYLRDALGFPVGPNIEGPVGYLARCGILATKGDAAPKTTLKVVKPLEKFERWLEHVGSRAQIATKIRDYMAKQKAKNLKSWP